MNLPGVESALAQAIWQNGLPLLRGKRELVLLCVGTDRSIGDALGPLIGSLLTDKADRGYDVVGTLDEPVHATNLTDTLRWMQEFYQNPLVVAVDASLGRSESIGMFTVGQGSLRPGAGVHKALPPVGDVFVTGVVNVGGFMEYFVLQNTRLSLVMRMARVAAAGIHKGLTRLDTSPTGDYSVEQV